MGAADLFFGDDLEIVHRGPQYPKETDPDRQDHLGSPRRGDVPQIDDVLPTIALEYLNDRLFRFRILPLKKV